ncbi:MAG: iron donor protein CyaY [Actinomycetota bacterium]
MSLDESRFHALADKTLEGLADAIDEALGDRLEVELDHGVINITLEDGGQYVINKHGPMRQIWLSSPVSGAAHFDWTGTDWRSTRDPAVELVATIVAEIEAKTGVRVAV